MAQITIDIPTASVSRVQDAFADKFGWTPGSGLTKAQFTKRHIIRYVKDMVKEHESGSQSKTLRETIESEVESINIT